MKFGKFLTAIILQLGIYFLSIPSLASVNDLNNIQISLQIAPIVITNKTQIKIMDAREFNNSIHKYFQELRYDTTHSPKDPILLKIEIKIWTGLDNFTLTQITQQINGVTNLKYPTLTHLFATGSISDLPSYLEFTVAKMAYDILDFNQLLPALPKKSIVAPSDTPIIETHTLNNPLRVDFSQVKTIYQPKPPRWPLEAMIRDVNSSTVIVSLTINPEGIPVSATALQGHQAFRESALAYGLKWRFAPAVLNGTPQWSEFRLNVIYKIKTRPQSRTPSPFNF